MRGGASGRLALVGRCAATLAVGTAAGALCVALHTPIPWMLGPLFAIAILGVAGAPVSLPVELRYAGQWIIGTSLGLYFTPQVIQQVIGIAWLLALGALFAIVLGYVSGLALARMSGLDRTTGVFASIPGGAAEMSVLGERFGGQMDRIAAAHSLRILMVVAIVPAAITALGVHGDDVYLPGTTRFDAWGFALLMALTLAGSLVLQRFGLVNAFVLGSLAVAIPLTAATIDLSSLPQPVSALGQLLIGCALGARFGPGFLRGAHRFVAAVALSVLLSIALAAGFGLALAWLAGQHPATMVLGNAPGGIAEMCITAKVLQLGVPIVTSFHVTRLFALLILTPLVFPRVREWYRGRRERRS